jgi:hypothetical protein
MRIITRALIIAFSFSLALPFTACKDRSLGDSGALPRVYHYTAFDSLGTVIVRGTMTFTNEDSTRFSGSWQCAAVGSPRNIGPQTGSGALKGMRSDSTVMVGLNPYIVDNNVGLSGRRVSGIITGEWRWTGFPGLLNEGRFILE